MLANRWNLPSNSSLDVPETLTHVWNIEHASHLIVPEVKRLVRNMLEFDGKQRRVAGYECTATGTDSGV